MRKIIKYGLLTITVLALTGISFAQNCKPKTVNVPANSKTVTLNGNIKDCSNYSIKIKKNQRLQIKLTTASKDVYFAMDPANLSEEEAGSDAFCEDCKTLDEHFDDDGNWEVWVYGIEAAEKKAIKYSLTLTISNEVVVSGGVLNGKAISLPKPPFPTTVTRYSGSGVVNVEVFIDEAGKVYSANAVSGNIIFYQSAETAARGAKFKPTVVNGKPMKVKGIIVYNIKPN